MQGRVRDALQFFLRRELDLKTPVTRIRSLQHVLFSGAHRRHFRPQPLFEVVFVLRHGKPPPGMLPDQCKMMITGTAVPRIQWGMIPQQVELPGDQDSDDFRDSVKARREIAEIPEGLEQQRYAIAVGLSSKAAYKDQRGHLNRNLRFQAQSWDQNRNFLVEIPSVVLVKIGAIGQDMLKRQQRDMR